MTLPTPYYQRDGITIYCGDCREILPQLPKVDLVLTDPPYGVRRPSARRSVGDRFAEIEGNSEVNGDWIKLVKVVDGGAAYVFCTWDTLEEWRRLLDQSLRVRSCIVWDKFIHGLADIETCFAPQHEMILFAANGRHILQRPRPTDILRSQRVSPHELFHPYQKPVPLIRQILNCSKGETVLDPFMGSGTTLLAAKLEGRQAIGIEIEEKFCQIAVSRLRQNVLPFDQIPNADESEVHRDLF